MSSIFCLEGIKDTNKCKIIYTGNINTSEKIIDTLIDKFDISSNIYGYIYTCNINQNYLLTTKNMPVFYINVIYEKTIIRDEILCFKILFNIIDDIKTEKEFINNDILGEYSLNIQLNNNIKILQILPEYNFNNYVNIIKEFINTTDIKQLITNICNDNNLKRVKQYSDIFDISSPPKITISNKDIIREMIQES
jgi:hypothetical protein